LALGEGFNEDASFSAQRPRAKSAATRTKEFIENRQKQELKFREIEHEMRMEV
jgi:hypothetical protein